MSTDLPEAFSATRTSDRDEALVDRARRQAQGKAGDGIETVGMSPGPSALGLDASPEVFPGYQLVGKLHGGGQGVVYKAIQLSTGKQVALKAIHHGPLADPRNRARLELGVHILSQLDHPHIVRIIDSGGKDGSMFYVMDYIPGSALDDWLLVWRSSGHDSTKMPAARGATTSRGRARESSRKQRVEIEQLLRLFVKICDAVAAAHVRGVIHRDLKPGNIRIDERGEPHVLDFDLAKILPGEMDPDGRWHDMTQTGEFLGSLRWASPEQVERLPSKIDLRTDVYSLGVVLYELLTGQSPYPTMGTRRDLENHILNTIPKAPSTLRRRIDGDVDTIILTCLAKEPQRRYGTAGALADDLRAYLAGAPINARRGNSWYLLRSLMKRHTALTLAFASVITILISTTAISVYFYRRENKAAEEKAVIAAQAVRDSTKYRTDALTAQDRSNRMMLGWFLSAWQNDQLHLAKLLRDTTPVNSPEREAMMFLLDPTYAEEKFIAGLPASASSLGEFVVGERRLKADDRTGAAGGFREPYDRPAIAGITTLPGHGSISSINKIRRDEPVQTQIQTGYDDETNELNTTVTRI